MVDIKDVEFVSMDDGDGGRRRTDEIGQLTGTFVVDGQTNLYVRLYCLAVALF